MPWRNFWLSKTFQSEVLNYNYDVGTFSRLNWVPNASILFVLVVETKSTVPFVLTKATFPGEVKPLPGRPVSLPLSTTLSTTSWSVPKPWWRTLLLSLMLHPNPSILFVFMVETKSTVHFVKDVWWNGKNCRWSLNCLGKKNSWTLLNVYLLSNKLQ